MRKKRSLEERRRIIVDYIKNNPNATCREIREKLNLNPNKAFKSLAEAFRKAKVNPPRTFKIKNKEERKKIIIEYLKKHPTAGGQTILKETKVNIFNAFNSTEEAFEVAGIKYPRVIDKRTKEEKKKEIVKTIRENPLASIVDITRRTKTQPYHFFKDINEIYTKAGLKVINGRKKWKLKKQIEIIEYIRKNPLATQREINKACKTHVQLIFKRGIFEAYEKAEIKFPFQRLKLYGIGIKEVRDRAKKFEEGIATKLSGYGKVNRLVKTKRGIADVIFERKEKKAIVEIKDYENKEISVPQIKQLNKYLEDCNCSFGFLICVNKPKRDRFLIGENQIFILNNEELYKIPLIMDP